jgi:hypothetical protein
MRRRATVSPCRLRPSLAMSRHPSCHRRSRRPALLRRSQRPPPTALQPPSRQAALSRRLLRSATQLSLIRSQRRRRPRRCSAHRALSRYARRTEHQARLATHRFVCSLLCTGGAVQRVQPAFQGAAFQDGPEGRRGGGLRTLHERQARRGGRPR